MSQQVMESFAAGGIPKTLPQVNPLPPLLEIANKIVLTYSLKSHWSTWHIWDYVRRVQPSAKEACHNTWQETAPFGTCIDLAFLVAQDLRAELSETEGLENFAGGVKTMTCPAPWDPLDKRPLHFLSAILLEQYCIIMDIGFHPKAFVVPLNGLFDTMPYLDFSGKTSFQRFRYTSPSQAEAPVLSMQGCGSDVGTEVPFSEIDHVTAVEHTQLRRAKATVETGDGKILPNRKYLTITSLTDKKPIRIPSISVLLDGVAKFVVTFSRIKIDFKKRWMAMQIPVQDWLLKPENAHWARYLQQEEAFTPVNEAVATLTLDLTLLQRNILL